MMIAAYSVYAVFWIRFLLHSLVWWRALRRFKQPGASASRSGMKACALTAADVVLFGRLLMVNPALWLGEWVFHVTLLLVLLRHLRFFLNPIPGWVWCVQTPGLIAGYVLPLSLAYILVIRLLGRHEKYASPANVFLLALILMISAIGVLMHVQFKPDLADVKLFVFGIMSFSQAVAPDSLLFVLHFSLVLVLIPFLPTHIFTAPLVMLEARKREQALKLVMHEK